VTTPPTREQTVQQRPDRGTTRTLGDKCGGRTWNHDLDDELWFAIER
jgi:hypothetical protein